MKDLSLFLAKNSFGAKIRKGLRTFCNDDGSTSTLNHNQADKQSSPSSKNTSIYMVDKKYDGLLDEKVSESSSRRRRRKSPPASSGMTLEDMILKLEMEEKQQELLQLGMRTKGRVANNKSKSGMAAENVLLMSARDALNIQYPRFSLDGRDAMYRSCFRKSQGRRSVCCDYRSSVVMNGSDRIKRFDMFGGERVVWCKPGVVAKLMGLDALPMPFKSNSSSNNKNDAIRSSISNNDQRRRLLVLGTTSTSTQLP